MASSQVVWVIDTSSIIEVRRSQRSQREQIFREMTRLVTEGRLLYPPQVVAELERNAQPKSPDPQFAWARQNASTASSNGSCSLDDVKEVLAEVPEVLDPNKDAGPDGSLRTRDRAEAPGGGYRRSRHYRGAEGYAHQDVDEHSRRHPRHPICSIGSLPEGGEGHPLHLVDPSYLD